MPHTILRESNHPPEEQRTVLAAFVSRLGVLSASVSLLGLLGFLFLSATILTTHGPFRFLGADFIGYYGAGRLVLQGSTESLYDHTAQVTLQRELLAPEAFAHLQQRPPVFSNPPALALLFAPLALLPIVPALAVWEAANAALSLAALAVLVRRAFGSAHPTMVAALFGFLPLLFGLFYGQLTGLVLASAVGVYLYLRSGRETWAGLLLSVLALLKPQYVAPIGLLLLVSGRWRALAGFGIGGLAVLGLSLALVGMDGLSAYARHLVWASGSEVGIESSNHALAMVNWRSLLEKFAPGAPSWIGLTLAAGTVAAALWAWRGHWQPGTPRFDRLFLALILATLLATVHSHIHGLVLALVPGAFLLSEVRDRTGRGLLLGTFALPTILFFVFLDDLAALATWLAVAMLVLLGALLWQGRPGRNSSTGAGPDYAGEVEQAAVV